MSAPLSPEEEANWREQFTIAGDHERDGAGNCWGGCEACTAEGQQRVAATLDAARAERDMHKGLREESAKAMVATASRAEKAEARVSELERDINQNHNPALAAAEARVGELEAALRHVDVAALLGEAAGNAPFMPARFLEQVRAALTSTSTHAHGTWLSEEQIGLVRKALLHSPFASDVPHSGLVVVALAILGEGT